MIYAKKISLLRSLEKQFTFDIIGERKAQPALFCTPLNSPPPPQPLSISEKKSDLENNTPYLYIYGNMLRALLSEALPVSHIS